MLKISIDGRPWMNTLVFHIECQQNDDFAGHKRCRKCPSCLSLCVQRAVLDEMEHDDHHETESL